MGGRSFFRPPFVQHDAAGDSMPPYARADIIRKHNSQKKKAGQMVCPALRNFNQT
jgi:hypothetical protein